MVDLITERFDCVLFDLGNTLIKQEIPGTPYETLSVQILPGVQKLLDLLRGRVKMGIVSNTQAITSVEIKHKLATVGLDKYFDLIIATAELGKHKPDPTPISAAIQQLKTTAERTLYVGDVETDMAATLAAGAHFSYTGPDAYAAVNQYLLHSSSAFDRAINTKSNFSMEHYEAVQK